LVSGSIARNTISGGCSMDRILSPAAPAYTLTRLQPRKINAPQAKTHYTHIYANIREPQAAGFCVGGGIRA
jgi:hypothetical protein